MGFASKSPKPTSADQAAPSLAQRACKYHCRRRVTTTTDLPPSGPIASRRSPRCVKRRPPRLCAAPHPAAIPACRRERRRHHLGRLPTAVSRMLSPGLPGRAVRSLLGTGPSGCERVGGPVTAQVEGDQPHMPDTPRRSCARPSASDATSYLGERGSTSPPRKRMSADNSRHARTALLMRRPSGIATARDPFRPAWSGPEGSVHAA